MEAAITLVSVAIGLYAGWRMLGRSVRAVWAAGVRTFVGWRAARPVDRTPAAPAGTGAGTDTYQASGITERDDLTDREWAHLLARAKRADKYRWSANQICDIVGGRRNDVLAWVREVRAPAPDEERLTQFEPQPHIQVPAYEAPPR